MRLVIVCLQLKFVLASYVITSFRKCLFGRTSQEIKNPWEKHILHFLPGTLTAYSTCYHPDSARPHNLALTEYSKKLEDPDRDIGRHPAAGLPNGSPTDLLQDHLHRVSRSRLSPNPVLFKGCPRLLISSKQFLILL